MAGNLVVLGKRRIAGFVVQHPAHELVGQDVLEVINHDDRLRRALHGPHDHG